MPPLTQDRLKRHADSDPEGEPPVKKFGLLQLGLSPRSSAAVQDTRKPIPQDYSINDGSMLLDDTKHTTYIYNIEQELADIEEHEKQISFIPEIEKALNAIPKSVLKEPETDKELVLYSIPRSLTVTEDKDAVRKAIIESRARNRAQNLNSDDNNSCSSDTTELCSQKSSLFSPRIRESFSQSDDMDVDL